MFSFSVFYLLHSLLCFPSTHAMCCCLLLGGAHGWATITPLALPQGKTCMRFRLRSPRPTLGHRVILRCRFWFYGCVFHIDILGLLGSTTLVGGIRIQFYFLPHGKKVLLKNTYERVRPVDLWSVLYHAWSFRLCVGCPGSSACGGRNTKPLL